MKQVKQVKTLFETLPLDRETMPPALAGNMNLRGRLVRNLKF